MTNTWVLKFPQVDLPDQPILVHVTQKQGFDLDLLATDGEAAYRGKVRDRNYSKLRAAGFNGTQEQWAAILRHSLISKQSSGISEEYVRNLEVQCSIVGSKSKAVLSITFRTLIENITSRLGAIELPYTEDTNDVDLFGWACQTVDIRDQLDNENADGKLQSAKLQNTIDSLQKQLTELVEAKNQYDKQMLAKFTLLLNEKKMKIRNQKRILEAVKVDHAKLEALQLTLEGDQLHATSKQTKRKGAKDKETTDSDESAGFDAMDIDLGSSTTPNAGSDALDEEMHGASTASESERGEDREEQHGIRTTKKLQSPPPPRALPFKRKDEKGKTKEIPQSTGVLEKGHEEQTASEDDEL